MTRTFAKALLWGSTVAGGAAVALSAAPSLAQDGPNSSLFSGQLRQQQMQYAMAAQQNGNFSQQNGGQSSGGQQPGEPAPTSWYEVPLPPAKEVREQDIVTIRVDLGARFLSEAQMQQRKNGKYDAILNDWLILEGLHAIKPAPQSDGDQRVQGQLNQLFRATSNMQTTDSIKFEIAAKVAAVLPNGTIVLEAHREITNNEEVWIHSLTGICRREDIGPGNIVLSKDVADLKIDKQETGHVRDGYRRGWLQRWFDTFSPF